MLAMEFTDPTLMRTSALKVCYVARPLLPNPCALLSNSGGLDDFLWGVARLVRPIIEKAVYMTGPLMSFAESYPERRNELMFHSGSG